MLVRSSAQGCVVLAPAKLNLFLEILAKRPDGFHELETLMVPIALFDTLVFHPDDSESIRLEVEQSSARGNESAETERLPEGSDNIVVRAVNLLRRRAGVAKGATLRLTKRIPLAAGLAGGSSDAAAALIAANWAWKLAWPLDQLVDLAAELGSDVPFFLGRGPAICRGRGEQIEPLAQLPSLHFVVARPPCGLSTADVYRRCQAASSVQAPTTLIAALRAGDLSRAGGLLHNRLTEPAGALTPWINRLQAAFAAEDFWGHGMSGSGTSYYGLCRHAGHARRVAARLRAKGWKRVMAVASCD